MLLFFVALGSVLTCSRPSKKCEDKTSISDTIHVLVGSTLYKRSYIDFYYADTAFFDIVKDSNKIIYQLRGGLEEYLYDDISKYKTEELFCFANQVSDEVVDIICDRSVNYMEVWLMERTNRFFKVKDRLLPVVSGTDTHLLGFRYDTQRNGGYLFRAEIDLKRKVFYFIGMECP